LNDLTKNLISTKEFELMKNNVVLINLACAGVVDEHALLEALNKNKIKAVAIQVSKKGVSEKCNMIDNEKVFPFPFFNNFDFENNEKAGLDVVSILKDFFNV
jgi:D-3-phosphoglycerate dehydrogenase